MKKVLAVAVLLVVAATPFAFVHGQGVAIPKFINITDQAKQASVKADCSARCSAAGSDTPDQCVAECVAAVDAKAPRDAASGLPTGKRQHEPVTIQADLQLSAKLNECKTACGVEYGTDQAGVTSCNTRCEAKFSVKAPRDSASGQATGKRTSEDCDDADDTCSPEARREAMKLKMEERKEEFEKHQADLKARLAKFKDQKRAAVVGRISVNVNELNEKFVERANAHLDKLSATLARVKVAAGDVNGDGTPDVAATEIASAQAAIDAATAAVAAQASASVTITVADESTVGKAVSTTRDAFKTAWEAVFAKIKEASLEVRASYDLAVNKKV